MADTEIPRELLDGYTRILATVTTTGRPAQSAALLQPASWCRHEQTGLPPADGRPGSARGPAAGRAGTGSGGQGRPLLVRRVTGGRAGGSAARPR